MEPILQAAGRGDYTDGVNVAREGAPPREAWGQNVHRNVNTAEFEQERCQSEGPTGPSNHRPDEGIATGAMPSIPEKEAVEIGNAGTDKAS